MSLENELKELIIKDLKLVDVTAKDIQDDDQLFGDGLGLDSLDAVELVVLLQKHYKIETKDLEESREVFTSIKTLADYVRSKRGNA
ncbi:MAG: phosphopantetheine-binding protein [Deltaproteobacteria bacterium]|nr:phosphopantetheine-binding protein [Deltaproteobacteria bacterium]